MTLAEKLIFLANRAEDGKKFYISTFTNHYFFNEEGLVYTEDDDGFVHETAFKIDTLLEYDFTLKKPIVLTEDERAILRNLPTHLNWITRDCGNDLYVFSPKPFKDGYLWIRGNIKEKDVECLSMYNHLFESIQWSDNEPCEFRKYI